MIKIIQHGVLSKHADMVESLVKPDRAIIAGFILSEGSANAMHMAVGISGEVGELLENVVGNLGRENFIEELGDTEFYMRGLKNQIGLKNYLEVNYANPTQGTLERAVIYASIKAAALLDAVKKYAIYEKPIDMEKAQRAFDGLLYSLECARTEANVTRQECLEHNLNKLGKRFSGGTYTNQAAQIRADKTKGE